MTEDRQKMDNWLHDASLNIQRLRHRCADPDVTDLMLQAELDQLRDSMPVTSAQATLPDFLALAPENTSEAELKCQVLRARLEMDETECAAPLDIRRVLGLLSDVTAHLVELDQILTAVAPAWHNMTRTAGVQDRTLESSRVSLPVLEQLRAFLVEPGKGRLQSALRAQRRAAQLCIALMGAVRRASSVVTKEISLDFDSRKIIDEVRSRVRVPTAEDYWHGFVNKSDFLTASEVEREMLKEIVTAVGQLIDHS